MCIYIHTYTYIPSKIKLTQASHRDSHFSYLCIMSIYVHGLYNAINFNKVCHDLLFMNVFDITAHQFLLQNFSNLFINATCFSVCCVVSSIVVTED